MIVAGAGHALEVSRRVTGMVQHGDARGRTLGFPTANLTAPDAVPDGVWAGWVELGSWFRHARYLAAVSVGRRPTYYHADGERLLEAFLLGFTGDLYGGVITVSLDVLLRNQHGFDTSDALVEQLRRDVDDVRSWASQTGAPHAPTLVERTSSRDR